MRVGDHCHAEVNKGETFPPPTTDRRPEAASGPQGIDGSVRPAAFGAAPAARLAAMRSAWIARGQSGSGVRMALPPVLPGPGSLSGWMRAGAGRPIARAAGAPGQPRPKAVLSSEIWSETGLARAGWAGIAPLP